MADLVVPQLGESITEAVISRWLKQVGDAVTADEPIAELETDKITVSLPAPAAGALTEQRAAAGATVRVGDVIGSIDTAAAGKAAEAPKAEAKEAPKAEAPKAEAPKAEAKEAPKPEAPKAEAPKEAPKAEGKAAVAPNQPTGRQPTVGGNAGGAAAVAAKTEKSSSSGALDKDALMRLTPSQRASARESGSLPNTQQPSRSAAPASSGPSDDARLAAVDPRDEIVPMSTLRKRVAERLVQAQQETASLTTFNEVDMTAVMELRAKFKDSFEKQHGVKLGFMSFFAKACVAAAKLYPGINAEVIGGNIVYKKHYDFGVAVSTPKGLVVPVLRDVDTLSFAGIEKGILELAEKARNGKLQLSDLSGGTFSITNGGIYGSMMSTPLLNFPQTGILGMHNIVKRALVINDEIKVRPVMYIALTYDHRVVDGKEAVSFLVAVKDRLEAPDRMLIDA